MRKNGLRYYGLPALGLCLLVGAGCPTEPDLLVGGDGNGSPNGDVVTRPTGDDVTQPCLGSEVPATTMHQAMLDSLNIYRIENGLNPLMYSKVLETAIEGHVNDLYVRDYFDHMNPDGESPADRAMAAGFCHQFVGENLAAGQPTLNRVMQAWKDSPPHNENLLEPEYVYVGMGVFTDPNGRIYWGQAFALSVP